MQNVYCPMCTWMICRQRVLDGAIELKCSGCKSIVYFKIKGRKVIRFFSVERLWINKNQR